MKKEHLRKIKKLAEKHFYCGKSLTDKERFLVENSPFADVLRPDKKNATFYKVLEQYGMENNVNLTDNRPVTRTVEKPYKPRYYNSINKGYLRELIDDVEEKFNLGTYNRSMYKFEGINVDLLKEFINQHCARNMIDREYPGTCKQITEVTDEEDNAYDLMYKLYSLQR